MSLMLDKKLNDNLEAIKEEIYRYKEGSRVDFFNDCINRKLKATLIRYNEETDQLSSFLMEKASMRVLKAITKINKQADKEVIYENMKGWYEDEN